MKNVINGLLLTICMTLVGVLFVGCNEVALKKIEIVGLPNEQIMVGQTFELSVVFSPDNTTDKRVTWSTPSNDVIRMEQISDTYVVIETLKTGQAIVYVQAHDGDLSDSVVINVASGTLNLRFQGAVNGVVTRTYNGQPQEMTVVGMNADEDITYLYRRSGETEYTSDAPKDVGTYDIRAEINSQNFTGSCEGSLQILPQDIFINAMDKEIVYGDEDVALTYRVVGTFYGQTPNIEGSLTREAGVNAGNYRIKAETPFTIDSEDSENYNIRFVEGNYTIRKANAVVTVTQKSVLYGREFGDFAYSVSGLLNDDSAESLHIAISAPQDARNVGTYTLLCEYDSVNYNLTFNNNRLSILKTPVTLTIEDEEKVYKYADPAEYTYTIFNSNNVENSSSLYYDDAFTLTYSRDVGENAGAYKIRAQVSGESTKNYNITIKAGTLTIKPRAVSAKVGDATKRYGQSDPTYTYEYLEGSDEVIDGELSIEFARDLGEDVGEYEITPRAVQEGANYVLTPYAGTLEITPALVSLSVRDTQKKYADADPAFDYVVDSSGDELQSSHTAEFDYIRESGEDVGTYSVSIVVAHSDPNYVFSTQSGLMRIVERSLVYDVGDITMRYYQNDEVGAPTLTLNTEIGDANVEELVIADYIDIVMPQNNSVGTYGIVVSLKAPIKNYKIEFRGGNLIIEQANIVVKMKDTQIYYASDIALEVEYLPTSDTLGADEIAYALPSEFAGLVDCGEYEIALLASQPNDNYHISIVSGTLKVVPAVIKIAVDDVSVKYGVQPNFTYSVTEVLGGLVADEYRIDLNSDGVDACLEAYDIVATLWQEKANYVLDATNGHLTISQANVIINVDSKQFKYGETLAFTYSLSGDAVVNDELDIALSGGSLAVGEHDILVNVEEKDGKANYAVTINGAKYTIVKRQYIFKIADAEKHIGDADPAPIYILTPESDELLAEDADITTLFTYSREEGEAEGEYATSAVAENSDHYDIIIYDGVLTIV